MLFIGDVHGKIENYCNLIKGLEEPSLQLGDMGLGFPMTMLPNQNPRHKFIRGNHDGPRACQKHFNYAGDCGYNPLNGLFHMGGAYSIDWQWRKTRMDHDPTPIWWPDEELSEEALEKAFDLYVESKPTTVATHECPTVVAGEMLRPMLVATYGNTGYHAAKLECSYSRTAKALQRMFDAHQPKQWLFVHYHTDSTLTVEGTEFTCLAELSTKRVDLC